MSFRIKINCQGGRQNHIGNPLVKLDDRTFETREEACDAIYAALEDVIQYDGCEMVGQSTYLSEDEYWLDRYCSACHAYILREGYATEDGVTATVEEVR